MSTFSSLVSVDASSVGTTTTGSVRHTPVGCVCHAVKPPGPVGIAAVHVPHDRLQALFLRVGLAFVFSYATWAMVVDPTKFTRYVPSFLPAPWVENLLLPAFSIFEVVLAIFLLTGRRLFVVSLLSTATMAGIIVVNPDHFDVLFRNVGIASAALALAVHAYKMGDPSNEASVADG